uniref:glucoside xylosyltransferase 2-like isoform X1 n=2 Tax=Oncorhynchus gorbuscha TaxID=8017 RepID=UPI001EAF5544|nr:glucoside xylosyltransferase 2-like isoform X1 [Oncorhynchus gorbuscha]
MRIHCKIVVIAVCLGVFLLLYFFGGNAADDPPLKEVEDNYFPKFSGLRNNIASKLTKKTLDELHIPHKQPLTYREVSKVSSRGGNAIAKSRQRSDMGVGRPASKRTHAEEVMHLAVVACGNRLDETLTMVKSALLFSIKSIKFHIFAEDPLTSQFEKGFLFQLSQWPHAITNKFQYSIYPITFSVGNAEEWKKLFKPCAAQRLFLPVILKDVDSLLYVDTDVLFLRPMDDIWSFLKAFNSTQLAAMAPEHEIPKIGWYSRFARHPFYGVTGVNSGVMLMNLTRIRSTLFKNSMITSGLSWEDLLHPLYQKYKNHITWGDQDLLNIIFHYNSVAEDVTRLSQNTMQREQSLSASLEHLSILIGSKERQRCSRSVCTPSHASGTTGLITACMGATVKELRRKACPFSMGTEECITTTSNQPLKSFMMQYTSTPLRTTCSSRCSIPSRPSFWTQSTPCVVGFPRCSSNRWKSP